MSYQSENVEERATTGVVYRQVNIMIGDSSSTTLNINTYSVTSGRWDPQYTPQLGQQITPGQNPMFVNFTDQPFTAVSGSITLSPMSGGLITLSWDWQYGSPFQQRSSTQNTTLGVSSQITGQTSTTVTVQYQITNAQS